jgi:hypothetical protein
MIPLVDTRSHLFGLDAIELDHELALIVRGKDAIGPRRLGPRRCAARRLSASSR